MNQKQPNPLSYTDDEGKKLYGFSQTSLDKLSNYVKLLAIFFVVFVILLVAFFLWIKFSGIGNNIVWELSRCKNY